MKIFLNDSLNQRFSKITSTSYHRIKWFKINFEKYFSFFRGRTVFQNSSDFLKGGEVDVEV